LFIMVKRRVGWFGNLVGKRKEEFTVLEEVVAEVVPQEVSRLAVLGRAVLRVPQAVRQEASQARRHQLARAAPQAMETLSGLPSERCIFRRREARLAPPFLSRQ
jgi:hypothetical protein